MALNSAEWTLLPTYLDTCVARVRISRIYQKLKQNGLVAAILEGTADEFQISQVTQTTQINYGHEMII